MIWSHPALVNVALRKESVDRNSSCRYVRRVASFVALRKESVDRNPPIGLSHGRAAVALRKESVDRNRKINTRGSEKMKSLSARRAWIEITSNREKRKYPVQSLSARRAWIEIVNCQARQGNFEVALRKESVDRNNRRPGTVQNTKIVALRKESVDRNTLSENPMISVDKSLSARRAWIEIIKKGRARRPGQSRSPQGERG